MWKLIKLLRLVRIMKFTKKQSIIKKATKALNLNSSFERFFLMMFGTILMCHILTCLFVFFASFGEDEPETFLNEDFKEMTVDVRYLTSMYFIMSTFSTVGYGDISASNHVEQLFCIFAMVIGVAVFSSATSAITNLLTNYD